MPNDATGPAIVSRPVRLLYEDRDVLMASVRYVAAEIHVTEIRVAASLFHFEIAEQFWALALRAWTIDRRLPTFADVRYRHGKGARVELAVPASSGQPPEIDAAGLATHVLDGQLGPLQDSLHASTRVAHGLLRGNTATALVLAARAIARRQRSMCVYDAVRRMLTDERLAGTLNGDVAGKIVRQSCCLYYRTPGGRPCGDCPLAGRRATTTSPGPQ